MELETTSIDLGNSGKTFFVKWYDPRNGGDLVDGPIQSVEANSEISLGFPPAAKEKDWVIYLKVTVE